MRGVGVAWLGILCVPGRLGAVAGPGRFAWVGLALGLVGCGGGAFRDVRGVSEVGPGERLLVGEVIAEGAALSNYALGTYLDTEVVFDRTLPDHELSVGEMNSLGSSVAEDMGANGGTFVVAAPTSDVYLLGVRVRGSEIVRTVRFLATPARIGASTARCSYVGSFVIRPARGGIDVEVRDDLDGALARSPARLKGCELLTRALAERVEHSAMVPIELPRAPEPEVPPVEVHDRATPYPLYGTTIASLQQAMRDHGLSGDTAGATEARLGVSIHCREYADGYALEKATVGLDLTTTLPEWQDRDRASANVQQHWAAFAKALALHEDGHRRIALDHANGFRAALTKLPHGPSCDAVQAAAQHLHGDWSDRLSAAQTTYDRETRHGVAQGTTL